MNEWIVGISGCASALAIIGVVINTVSTHRVTRFLNQHDTLWDSHNQKKDDSVKLQILQENFTTHEKKFEIFAATQTNSNTLFMSKFEELNALIVHKENGQKQVTNSMISILERIEDKLTQ